MNAEKVFEPICDLKFKTYYRIYKQKILPKNHRTSKRVNRIVEQILESNPEFTELQNKNWSVFVVKDPENVNAFVLLTGQIFVFTGVMKLCDSDSQLGVILSYELSHAFLGHGRESVIENILINRKLFSKIKN
jgi:predicted Zn-dependent protease